MRSLMFAAAALAALVTPALAQDRAALSGVWVGYYAYEGQGGVVQFQARLSSNGRAFSGATVEPNTFGNAGVLFLTANLAGAADASGKVSFVKTYDGTGGQSHSVQYAGAFNTAGNCITGTWAIGQGGGPFNMCAEPRPNS